MHKVNLAEAFASFSDPWNPRIAGDINGFQVKLVKLAGAFDWHHHEVEDELFLVVAGRMRMGFRYRDIDLEAGEFIIVPHGVEHRPEALSDECQVLLLEPALNPVWVWLVQGERPKGRLLEEFADDETSCLFATLGFWQGVDVPGPSLSLVTIDRIPFPRPDDPLLRARRAALGARAFEMIDVPRAATLLAQGVEGQVARDAAEPGTQFGRFAQLG